MQVEGHHGYDLSYLVATGARVRNAYPIYLLLGDRPLKDGLILDSMLCTHVCDIKDLSVTDGDASD